MELNVWIFLKLINRLDGCEFRFLSVWIGNLVSEVGGVVWLI